MSRITTVPAAVLLLCSFLVASTGTSSASVSPILHYNDQISHFHDCPNTEGSDICDGFQWGGSPCSGVRSPVVVIAGKGRMAILQYLNAQYYYRGHAGDPYTTYRVTVADTGGYIEVEYNAGNFAKPWFSCANP